MSEDAPEPGPDESPEDQLIRAFAAFVRSSPSAGTRAEPSPEPLLSLADAAGYLNVSTTTVRNLAVGGKLRSARVGDRIRFRRSWLDEWIDAGGGDVPPPPPPEPKPVVERAVVPRVARPARPRQALKPKPPTYIQLVDGEELRLLADRGGERFGRFYTWHAGTKTPLCGAEGRWSGSLERVPSAFFCKACLTMLGARPEVDLSRFGVGHVYMLRMTVRGKAPTSIRAGYHEGDGRKTLCGKRDGPWALTEREPRATECFVCDHRVRWNNRDMDRNWLGPRPDTPTLVLIDAGPLDQRLTALASAHPTALEIRHAREPLPEHLHWSGAKWMAAFAAATPIGDFHAPDRSIVGSREHWGTITLSHSTDVGWPLTGEQHQQLERRADAFDRAYALYARWAKEGRQASRP